MELEVELETASARLARAQQVASELAMVVEIARDLAGSIETRDVGEVLLRIARELTGTTECALWIKGKNGEVLQRTTDAGEQTSEALGVGRSQLLLQAIERRQPVVECDKQDGAQQEAAVKHVAFPVLFQHEVLGVLELGNLAAPEHWDDQKVALERVLPMVGLALKNSLVLEENKQVNGRLKKALENLEESNRLLRAQNETIAAQAEEIGAQNDEIRSRNEQLQAQQQELAAKAAENARLLRQAMEERNRIHAVISASADGVLVIDSDRKVATVNTALERLTGFRAEELIGKPCSHLLDVRDSSGACICDFACPHSGSDLLIDRTIDATIGSQTSERVWVGVATGVIRDDNGDVRGVVHTFRDMTKYKEADRMKDEFILVASHELMTPLTALKGFAQLAQKIGSKCTDNWSLTKSLEILNEEVDKLISLVTRLLDVSRLQAKRLDVHRVNLDLVDLAESAIARVQATTNVHTFRLVGAGPVNVYADPEQIEQVLANLLGNAVKYSPSGGDVEVKIEAHDSFVQVSVSDQGIGIPLDKQARVFDRFYRAHDGPRGYSRGMGIGLYICREIVSLYGGQIWVRSEEGKGSVFYFTLPLGEAD